MKHEEPLSTEQMITETYRKANLAVQLGIINLIFLVIIALGVL